MTSPFFLFYIAVLKGSKWGEWAGLESFKCTDYKQLRPCLLPQMVKF
ncbi:MAG: hypothetical protein RR060_03800 [Victivallaceae bacterium]